MSVETLPPPMNLEIAKAMPEEVKNTIEPLIENLTQKKAALMNQQNLSEEDADSKATSQAYDKSLALLKIAQNNPRDNNCLATWYFIVRLEEELKTLQSKELPATQQILAGTAAYFHTNKLYYNYYEKWLLKHRSADQYTEENKRQLQELKEGNLKPYLQIWEANN